jgi:hypothetical protein
MLHCCRQGIEKAQTASTFGHPERGVPRRYYETPLNPGH